MDLPPLPAALHWDHNAHYHPWLLRQLPARPDRVLDVGCGAGGLACLLTHRAGRVDGLDRSAVMIERARRRCSGVNWIEGDLLDPTTAPAGRYDAVTAVSSLHHLPVRPALQRIGQLLAPGGVLAVVGLARPSTAADVALALAAVPANAAVGVARALQGRAGKHDDDGMPVHDPEISLAEVRAAAAELLPGARIRRGLYWRYLLSWTKPPG